MSPVQNLTGQELVNGALSRLGGYANAIPPEDMLDFINEGKNELWSYLKGLRADYFGAFSQSTTSTDDDYFPNLTPSTREYELPLACREVKTIEVLTPGYETVQFEHADMSSPQFKDARTEANASGSGAGGTGGPVVYYWDVFGTKFVLAQYPETTMAVKLGYIEAIPDIELGEAASKFLFPFLGKLKNFGAKRATLGLRDMGLFEAWKSEWKNDLQVVLAGASERQIADAQFAEEFLADEV